jgi:hypothetical protein
MSRGHFVAKPEAAAEPPVAAADVAGPRPVELQAGAAAVAAVAAAVAVAVARRAQTRVPEPEAVRRARLHY